MDPRARSSLLWGLVGGLSFLVLLQGYQLLSGAFVGAGTAFGVTTLVFAASVAITHLLWPRLVARNERP